MSFARTKIQPPRLRPGAIARPALERRLDAALHSCRLVLLTAPAGFGKTSALARQLAHLPAGSALAWIGCDEDDDLPRLLDCLVAALEPIDPPWRSDPNALPARAAGSRSQRRAAADELLNVLAACDVPRGLIVLDDVQRIEDPAVFEFLDMLLPGLPAGWVLLLAGREPPPLALARMRVQGELAELRQAELQFGVDEVQALLQATPGAAARVDAAQLCARTEGWAVGLRLALDALLEGKADGRSLRSAALDRHVFDYLASEVLERMPPGLREFLLRCAVLPELSAARCAKVSGDPAAARWLQEIEARGLFVTVLDTPELTLRVHDLMRDFLEDRLQRELPGELPQLLRRAAADEDDPVRRIGYLLRAGADEEARVALEQIGPRLMTEGEIAPVLRLVEQFPAALRDGPELLLLQSLGAWALWDFERMSQLTHRSAAGFEARGDTAGMRRAMAYQAIALNGAYRQVQADALLERLLALPLEGEVLACVLHADVWRAVDRGPLDRVAPRFERELEAVERLDTALLWYQASPVGRYLGLPGIVPPLARYAEGALRHAGTGVSPLRVLAVTVQACLRVWAGDPDAAEALLTPVEDDARWLGQARSLGTQFELCRALLHALRGETDLSLAAAQRLLELQHDVEGPRRRTVMQMLLLHQARLSAVLGDTVRLRRIAAELQAVGPLGTDGPASAQHELLAAYLADADGHRQQAVHIRRRALQNDALLWRLGLGVETRLRLAADLLRQGDFSGAAEAVRAAQRDTDDGTELAPVLLAGPAVLDTLAQAHWQQQLDDPARARLRRWAEHAQRLRRQPAVPAATTPQPLGGLSPREFEVLQRIAAGDSNKLIARAFDLSPHTVKRHVANILDKLGLQSRGQAAAWLHAQQP